MKNKLRRDIFVIIFLLLVACIALAVPLAFSNPRWLLAPALLVVFALVVAVLGIRRQDPVFAGGFFHPHCPDYRRLRGVV